MATATSDSALIDNGIALAEGQKREIADGVARIIGSMYHDGTGFTYAFASTGAILCDDSGELWRALFPDWQSLPPRERIWANWLGTYLIHRKDRGPVAGWGNLWGDSSFPA